MVPVDFCPLCDRCSHAVKPRVVYERNGDVTWPEKAAEVGATHYCAGCRLFFGGRDGRCWQCTGGKTSGAVGHLVYTKPGTDPDAVGPTGSFLGGIT